jgi:hypothetical protein
VTRIAFIVWIVAVWVALAGWVTAAGAQDLQLTLQTDSLRAGERARVWQSVRGAGQIETKGTVQSIVGDSLRVAVPHLAQPVAIPWSTVMHVDVSEGPASGPRWRSTLIGAAFGVVAGAIGGVVIGNAANKNAAKLGFAGIGVGAVGGGVIGYFLPGEAWRPALLPARAGRPIGSPAIASPGPGGCPPPGC